MGVADVSSRGHCQLFGCFVVIASATSNCNVQGLTDYHIGSHRMSLSPWNEGSDSDHAAGMNRDKRLVGHRKIPAGQWAKLPRYMREWAVEVRPFTAKKRLLVSEAQGLSGEAVKGNPTTTVIPGVDESKSSPRTNRRLDRTVRFTISARCPCAF